MFKLNTHFRSQAAWFFIFFSFFSIQQLLNWPLMQFLLLKYEQKFVDLGIILSVVECGDSANTGFNSSNSFWKECGYMYGSSLNTFLGLLKLSSNDTNWVGWFFIGAISLFFAFVFSKIRLNFSMLSVGSFFCIFSPPVMLLLERGNFDLLIVLMISLGSILYKGPWKVLSIILIGASALFKFYTLPLAFFVSVTLKKSYEKILATVFIFFVTIRILDDLRNMQSEIPRLVWGSFGNASLGLYIDFQVFPTSIALQNFLGVVQLLLIFLFLNQFSITRRALKTPLIGPDFFGSQIGRVQVFFIIIFFSCYFAGMSFDYRLIFLIVPCIIEANRLYELQTQFSLLLILTIASAWFSLLAGNHQPLGDLARLQPLGDLCISVLVIYFAHLYFRSFMDWRMVRKSTSTNRTVASLDS